MLILLKKKKYNHQIKPFLLTYLFTYVRDFSFILFCKIYIYIYIYILFCKTGINGDGFMDLMTADLVMVSSTVMLVSTVGLSAPSTT